MINIIEIEMIYHRLDINLSHVSAFFNHFTNCGHVLEILGINNRLIPVFI